MRKIVIFKKHDTRNKTHHNQLLAIIISNRFNDAGIHFFTPDDFSQQMAFMKHPQGKSQQYTF